MTKLPAVRSREVVRALERAGFVVTRTSGSHCRLVHGNDPARAVTVPIHAGRDIKPETLQAILRQTGLTVDELKELL